MATISVLQTRLRERRPQRLHPLLLLVQDGRGGREQEGEGLQAEQEEGARRALERGQPAGGRQPRQPPHGPQPVQDDELRGPVAGRAVSAAGAQRPEPLLGLHVPRHDLLPGIILKLTKT